MCYIQNNSFSDIIGVLVFFKQQVFSQCHLSGEWMDISITCKIWETVKGNLFVQENTIFLLGISITVFLCLSYQCILGTDALFLRLAKCAPGWIIPKVLSIPDTYDLDDL